MRIMTLLGIAIAFLYLPVQGELKREALAGPGASDPAAASNPPAASKPPAALDPALDPPLPPGPQELPTGFQIALHGSKTKLHNCPVVEVTLNSITVFYTGYSGWRTLANGERKWESMPSRRIRFSVGKELSNGGFTKLCVGFGWDASYPLALVAVGDRVSLEINVEDSRYVCTGICIWRRPGGRVPKAPFDTGDDDAHHHYEGANALQDVEEKGIPLPWKYNFLSGHLPPHLQNKVMGLAPMPRKAKK